MIFDAVVLIVGGGLVVVSLVMAMLYLTLMFWLIIQNVSFDFHVSSPSVMLGPSDAGAFITASGAPGQGLAKSPDIPALFEPGTREGRTGPARAERATAELSSPLLLGASGDSLQPSDGLSGVLAILGRSVEEIFPANRVTMKCSRCGHYVPRGEGYRHINVGVKKTYCAACHEAMQLPLREAAGGARRCA